MRKGFTLVELLAVIVILAIISLIAMPTLTKVISNVKANAAIESARGYIDSVNTQIISNDLDMSDETIKDGTYNSTELKVEAKGQKPSNAIITIEKNQVKEARLCIGKYSVDYDGENFTNSSNEYCGDTKITLVSNGKEVSSTKSNTITVNLKDVTNINCNNGSIPEVEGTTLTAKYAIGNTTCELSNSLKTTFSHLNKNDNNIIMVSDETIKNGGLTVPEDKRVIFNLNGKTVKTVNTSDLEEKKTTFSDAYVLFNVLGNLIINDTTSNGHAISYIGSPVIYIRKQGKITINGGNFKGRNVAQNYGEKNSLLTINGGYFESKLYAIIYSNSDNARNIINGGTFYSEKDKCLVIEKGKATINGGSFISLVDDSILVKNGLLEINQFNTPIYVSSRAIGWKPAIMNITGSINIKASLANKCSDNINDTKSGLCVYATGDGTGKTSSNGNLAVENGGTMHIDGGTYYGGYHGIYNFYKLNVTNAVIYSDRTAIRVDRNSTSNICNSKIKAQLQDLGIWNNEDIENKVSVINYDYKTIFTNGTNKPAIVNNSPLSSINGNYTGTCTK